MKRLQVMIDDYSARPIDIDQSFGFLLQLVRDLDKERSTTQKRV